MVTAASRHLRPFAMPRLSPDGRSVALEVHEGAHAIWVLDLDRDALTRVSYAARVHNFAWGPDSRSLLFTRSDDDKQVIAWKRVGDPGDGELVLKLEGHDLWVDSWSADGRWAGISDLGRGDAWLLPMTPGEPPQPAGELIPVGTPQYRERDVMVIPHGRCVAYTSNETGRAEVYLRCLDTGERIQVSSDGGQEPMWADDGDSLYFRSGDRLMRAEVSFAGGLRVRPPVEVHHGDYLQFDPANYDVDDAGGRVLRIRSATEPGSNRRVSIRFGFQRELERLVPLAGAGS
jgi:Tol biopolymer transport system component